MGHTIKTIGIFSPSSSIDGKKFDTGCSILKNLGYELIIHPQTYKNRGDQSQISTSPTDKATAYRELASNPDIDLIMASTGGNRSCFLLNGFHESPDKTPIMGFSDTTPLLCSHYKNGIKGYFGPTVQTLARMDSSHLQITQKILQNTHASLIVPLEDSTVIHQGVVTAPVFAATLSNLVSLCGTSYMPDLQGHILILEDVGDEISRFDRMLWTLSTVIDFKKLSGLIFGQFLNATDTGRSYGESMNEIINKYTQLAGCPAIINAPIGHDGRIFPIPLGQSITLDATNRILIF